MLVYGERPRSESTEALIDTLEMQLFSLPAGGVERHGALVEAFILAGELAQGLADAAFAAVGADGPSPAQDAAMDLVMDLARAVLKSWRDRFAPVRLGRAPALAAVRRLDLPERVETRTGEGYAFYGVYPEAYAEAAAKLSARPRTVVGVRSIGTSLSAMVAAALDAPRPITVRPVGDPFRRELRLTSAFEERVRPAAPEGFAIVDEGPGLSGSSFRAVAEALEGAGAAPESLTFFPSHAGEPGGAADPAWRERWRRARRSVVGLDELLIDTPQHEHRLLTWATELVGAPVAPLEDLSGGAWRGLRYADEADWPPADTFRERRKFLMRTGGGGWLLKFTGLGRDARGKLARAHALADAGFTPQPAGLRHGFLIERWIDRARPLDPDRFGRDGLIAHLGRYLGFRAARFPAAPGAGASLGELKDMARANAAEALGAAAAAAMDRWADLARLERRVRRVEIDGRLHAWEWLVTPGGRLIKTDAVDHARGHDLVGAQDLAWDLAGAAVEFDLTSAEVEALIRACRQPVDRELLGFLTPCYLAFQLGLCAMGADAHVGWPAEAARLRTMRDRYARRLAQALEASTTAGGPA